MDPRAPVARPEMSWSGWGDPAAATPLPESVRALVRDGLGARAEDAPRTPATLDELALEPVRIPAAALAELEAIVGAEQARSDHETRARHALGRSTIDLLKLRGAGPLPAPDVVLFPGSHDEILELLACASRLRVAIVPFGGGTSVVGGLTPEAAGYAGVAAIDLRRLDRLVSLDEVSRLAVLEPGLTGPQAEALLGARGYTLGHFPQSWQYASLGGFAAARSSGQASAGYGRFDELVMALRLATPSGTLELGRAPRSAAGPDLRQLALGSEGALGVITALTLAVRPSPEARVYEGWLMPTFAAGAELLRTLAQDGPRATVLRLSDEAETALGLAQPDRLGAAGGGGGGCLAIIGWEGETEDVKRRRSATAELLERAGARPVDGAGEDWAAGRFQAPYLRDALLDAGALVETLETVTWWSSVETLHGAVSAALRDSLTGFGTPPAILAHISHVYPAGASLYFTVACAQAPDPIAQWRAAKAAAAEAILAAGASITHHHGIGTDHRAPYERELGPLAIAALRAVKRELDPAWILNPGVLLAAGGAGEGATA